MLKAIHPSQMYIGAQRQYEFILKCARLAFQGISPENEDDLPNVMKDFTPVVNTLFVIPHIFQSTHPRDVFKLQMRLFDSMKIDGKDFINAKTLFHDMLSAYKPEEGDARILDTTVSRSAQGLHVLSHQWEGRYFSDSHSFALLIQGLRHVKED